MAHVGKEARLRFVGAAEVIGFFIQLCDQRHHAAVCVFQLPVHPDQFFLPRPELLQRGDQLPILPLQLVQGSFGLLTP